MVQHDRTSIWCSKKGPRYVAAIKGSALDGKKTPAIEKISQSIMLRNEQNQYSSEIIGRAGGCDLNAIISEPKTRMTVGLYFK